MTIDVYDGNNGIAMGSAEVGGGGVKADGALYQYMGSVATYNDLLALDTTDFKPGYTYDVQEDGMDYSWTGTEWNALGTHTDLSNYYTKDQTYAKSETYSKTEENALLDEKQDKLTPNAPLMISKYTKSNLNGMVYNTDGTTIYTDPSIGGNFRGLYTYYAGGTTLIALTSLPNYFPSSNLPSLHDFYEQVGYVDIPYSMGYIVNTSNLQSNGFGSFTLGKVLNGEYIQILAFRYGGSSSYPWEWLVNTSDETPTVVRTDNYYGAARITTSQSSGSFTASKTNCSDTLGTLTQIIDNTNSISVRFKIGSYLWTYTFTNAQLCTRLREIDTVRIFASYDRGYDINTAFQTSSIGLYNTDMQISGDETSYTPWGENLFDISGEQAYNYLDLHIGAGLSVDGNGNLINTNPTPYTAGNGVDIANNEISILAGAGLSFSNIAQLPNTYVSSSSDITASSQEVGQYAFQAFDGNTGTYWGLTEQPSSSNHAWIQRSHDAVKVTSVRILFTSESIMDIYIKGSNDGINFTQIGQFTNNTNTDITITCNPSQTYTYTRIEYGQPYSGWGQTKEIQINYETNSSVLINTNPTAPTVMTGATSSTAGTAGLVPAPAAGDDTKFLSGDGTYKTVATDLSNYYNKSETDAKLAQKQDVLTPNAPLTIASYIRSNAYGFTFSDSSHIYSTSGSFREYYAPLGEYAGNFISCNTSSTDMWANSTFSTTQENFKSYIDIPLSKDKMITVPSDMALFIGYYNEDGVFLPISQLVETFSYTDGSGYYFYVTAGSNLLRVPQSKLTTTNTTNQPQVTTYSKFYLKDAGSSLTLQWQSVYDAQSTIRTTNIESTSILASRMTVARVVRRNNSVGYNPSNAIDVSMLGLYNYTGNFADFDPSGLTNLFDITGQQAYNYLDLHIGTGLAVQNGNLVNTNPTAPTVMTGATSSTAGTAGLVPAPAAGDNEKFLSGDGTYKSVPAPDLSSYYTKVQTNEILDEYIPNSSVVSPLTYTKITHSVDCVDTDNGVFWSKTSASYDFPLNSYDGSYNYTIDAPTTSGGNGVLDSSKVLFYVGDVVGKTVRCSATTNASSMHRQGSACVIGNMDLSGKFTPYFIVPEISRSYNTPYWIYFYEVDAANTTIANSTQYSGLTATKWTMPSAGTTQLYSNSTNAWMMDVTIQDNSGYAAITIQMFNSSGTSVGTVTYNSSTPNVLDQLNCVLFPLKTSGTPSVNNNNYYVDKVGIFESGTQIWSVGDSTSAKYLQLGIGAGLAVQSGNLVNTNPTAPDLTNYAVKNAAQTFSAKQTFGSGIAVTGRLVMNDAYAVIQNSGGQRFASLSTSDSELIIGEDSFATKIKGTTVSDDNGNVFLKENTGVKGTGIREARALTQAQYDAIGKLYGWGGSGNYFTKSETPSVGDTVYDSSGAVVSGVTVTAYDSANDYITITNDQGNFPRNSSSDFIASTFYDATTLYVIRNVVA